jgi:hypothetical protein
VFLAFIALASVHDCSQPCECYNIIIPYKSNPFETIIEILVASLSDQ